MNKEKLPKLKEDPKVNTKLVNKLQEKVFHIRLQTSNQVY